MLIHERYAHVMGRDVADRLERFLKDNGVTEQNSGIYHLSRDKDTGLFQLRRNGHLTAILEPRQEPHHDRMA
jgi:hypothetical protein